MNQTAPKFIGKRISILRGNKELTITIHQKIERWQEALLLAWLAAWTFCGVMFFFYLLKTTSNSERLFFIVITSLWLFFFVRIAKVLLWRIAGREIITLKPGTLSIQNAFWNRGKVQVFQIRNIFKLGTIKKNNTNFFAFLDDSFWIMGGDKIGFSHSGTKIQFGKQLNARDTESLVRTLDFGIK
jgi:hypothetical protein